MNMTMKYKTKWNLDDDFAYTIDSEKIKEDYLKYSNRIDIFERKWNGIDTATGLPSWAAITNFFKSSFLENFECFLNELDMLNKDIYPLLKYLSLKSSIDVSDQSIQKISSEIYKNLEDLSEKLLFVDTIWKSIGYDKLIELSKIHKDYSNYLVSVANSIKYILSEKEERIILKLNSGNDLYDEYKTSITLQYKGDDKTITDIWGDRTSENRDDRILSYKTLSDFYNKDYNNVIFKNIYSDVCKSNISNMEVRGISDVMHSRNISEEMDNDVVDKLINIITDNYSLFSDYLKKKKEYLKLDDFNVYDILAPISYNGNSKLDFDKGCDIYLSTIRKVDESIYQHGLKMLDGKTDVYPVKGKRGGAFCSYDKFNDQYVLLNWQDKLDDLNTLAHEFGHAFHGYLSLEQNNTNYSSPLVLAETASIFNETIMFNESLKISENDEERKVLIYNRLDDIFSTIFRQIMYIRFERICHQSWKENTPLTSDDYNRIWLNEFKLLVGDSIIWNKENEDLVKWGWMSIPHIYHTPFYCYAYSFGNLLSLNIYEEYEKSEDKSLFMDRYFSLLKSGGSVRPKEILNNIFGYNIDEDQFYLSGLNYIKTLLNKI